MIFVLHPRNYRPPGEEFRLGYGGKTTQWVEIQVVPLWEVEPDPSWEQSAALMALYPLCRHPEPPSEAIRHAAGVIRRKASGSADRADLLSILGLFGRLAYPDLNPVALIGREHMRESPLYQEIMDEGSILTARRYILTIVAGRFGKRAANSVELAVNAVEDLPRLDQLVSVAVRCASIDAFREELEGPRPTAAPRRRPSSRR